MVYKRSPPLPDTTRNEIAEDDDGEKRKKKRTQREDGTYLSPIPGGEIPD